MSPDVVGPINAARFVAFIWKVAGRPKDAPADWKRERPVMIVLDNYSVHKSQTVKDSQTAWEAADVFLVPLPSYCPEMSRIEPVWNDVKHHHLPTRSFEHVASLKRSVDNALNQKAILLKQTHGLTTNLLRLTT
jgi:transposase